MENKVIEFKHCVVEGTPYEAGRQLGEIFKQDKEFIKFMTSPFNENKLSKLQVSRVIELFDIFSPGLNEEIEGFADAVNANAEDVVYYFVFLQILSCNCSHISLTPQVTDNGHSYLGRNYDFGWYDKPMLIETHIKGQYSQIGFGCQIFGRFDGINEHGLCVTTSAGVINPDYNEDGFVFPFIVRSILNKCQTVDQAIKYIHTLKIADYRNFIISDRFGNSVLIEIAASKKETKLAGESVVDKYLFSTNHYNIPYMKNLGFPVAKHSIVRYEALKSAIVASLPKISKEELKKILSTRMPDGVCCHHYADGMGTLWSMIFDPMDKSVDICFGSPNVNLWRTFHLNGHAGVEVYSSLLPNEPVDTDFWDTTIQNAL